MIQLDYVDRALSPQTAPVVCMHCDTPTCAEVCPADAIKRTADGVVQTARKPRCIACNNCVLACPFGVPKMNTGMSLMMKCDMCYDRTSVGKKPMCASVCPSQALFYGTREEIEASRPRSRPVDTFRFGHHTVTTKVSMMVPRDSVLHAFDVLSRSCRREMRRSIPCWRCSTSRTARREEARMTRDHDEAAPHLGRTPWSSSRIGAATSDRDVRRTSTCHGAISRASWVLISSAFACGQLWIVGRTPGANGGANRR
jgi:Fe-S-cluster-containing dehydrogenase component